ncbi:hypothetical protein, partial [Myxococcus sp. AM011]|uniref:hypothetical protein n=1 Tax=Myxococcus sp. AM011 TaxID=2745200 RepID=UPI001C3C6159
QMGIRDRGLLGGSGLRSGCLLGGSFFWSGGSTGQDGGAAKGKEQGSQGHADSNTSSPRKLRKVARAR